MAGVYGIVSSGAQALAAATAETVLQIVAAAEQRVLIKEIVISFDDDDSTAVPVTVELLRQTSAGTSSAATVSKLNEADDETLQTTARNAVTVEPTGTTVVGPALYIPAYNGGYSWRANEGEEIPVMGGSRLGVRCTAPATVNAIVTIIFEE